VDLTKRSPQFPVCTKTRLFLTKVYLNLAVFVSDECWDRYRIHPNQLCAKVIRSGEKPTATAFYLNWAAEYLSSQDALDAETK